MVFPATAIVAPYDHPDFTSNASSEDLLGASLNNPPFYVRRRECSNFRCARSPYFQLNMPSIVIKPRCGACPLFGKRVFRERSLCCRRWNKVWAKISPESPGLHFSNFQNACKTGRDMTLTNKNGIGCAGLLSPPPLRAGIPRGRDSIRGCESSRNNLQAGAQKCSTNNKRAHKVREIVQPGYLSLHNASCLSSPTNAYWL
jgi:hypothetical protein